MTEPSAQKHVSALAQRLEQLEQRVAKLEQTTDTEPSTPEPKVHDSATDMGTIFWALQGLKQRLPAPGGVLFTGSVQTPLGSVEWQQAAPTADILERDWTEHASAIAALGNEVRLRILQAVIKGAITVSELTQREEFGTSGQIYHHVSMLTNTGWLQSSRRGQFTMPPQRVVPLMVILAATT